MPNQRTLIELATMAEVNEYLTEREHPPRSVWAWPAALERTCRVCGCIEYDPCRGGCAWVERDLCSRCV